MVKQSRTNVVIIVPTPWEALPLHDEIMMGLSPDPVFHNCPYPTYTQDFHTGRIVLIESYIAPHNAAGAAGWAIATHNPTYFLMAGSAGATHAELLPGDIVIGSEYTQIFPPSVVANRNKLHLPASSCRYLSSGKAIHTGAVEVDDFLLREAVLACDEVIPTLTPWPEMARGPRYITGKIGSMDDWSTNLADFERLKMAGVDVEDMESAFVAMVAASHKIPFLAIRGVSNNGPLGLQPKSFEEIKATSQLATSNAGHVLSHLIPRLMK
jgi:nucleoside phosphorylase